MPKTIRATKMGFCPGVKRALSLAGSAVEGGGAVFTLGRIVHNQLVADGLAARGARVISDPAEATSGTVVLRSHGAERQDVVRLRKSNVTIVDGTCPKVLRLHRLAEDAVADGVLLVVVGDPGHAEVRGIVSRAPGALVISSPEDAVSADLPPRIRMIVQTTFGRAHFLEIASVLKDRCAEVEVFDTLCTEIDARLEAVGPLADHVDAILIVGDRTSANTSRLLEAAKATGLPSWRVEGPDDIPAEIRRVGTVGITAGASTPEAAIEAVEKAVNEL